MTHDANHHSKHIIMQFGLDLDCQHCPSIHCAVDSCAAFTMENFHFFGSLVKLFPHCITKVFARQDYTLITFLGIVQSNQMGSWPPVSPLVQNQGG
jgi:hypothetical protein